MSEESSEEKKIGIVDLFKNELIIEAGSGTYKLECPHCGLQGGRTEGFILFPDTNQAHCHSSGKWFKLLEAYALRHGIIKCLDGREPGESDKKVLGGELWTLTLETFKNEFGSEMYERLLEQLRIRKDIELPGNGKLISKYCDELGDIYKTRNVLFFRRESRDIVEIGRYKNMDGDKHEYKETGFIPINANRFITLAEMLVKPWINVFGKNGTPVQVLKSMNQTVAATVLESPNFQNKLPIISRIFDIQIPILYRNKLTFPKKGYDKRFGSWLPYNAPEIVKGMYNLQEAKAIIDEIFKEFCFASEKDRIHAIAALLTPFLRGLFQSFSTRTPVFVYMANRERAGKDYCAGCTGILYEGVNTEEPAICNDEKGNSNHNEELRKKITACMIQGKKRFHSSNNKGLLNNSVFEGITTSPSWNDRILGRSVNVTFPNEMDYSLSGNIGMKLTPDLTNRARIINLHLVEEDANARTFEKPNLHEWILERRSMIISALYTLIENWVALGMPSGSVPFTSFPEWARVCGGIMECAGYASPCMKDNSVMVSLDDETEEMKLLFEACYAKFPNKWMTKDEIKTVVEEELLMPEMDFSNHSHKTKFGLKIDKYSKRMLSDILMEVDDPNTRADRRKYVFGKLNDDNRLNELLNVKDNKVGRVVGIGRDIHPATINLNLLGGVEESLPNPPTLPLLPQNNELMRTFEKRMSDFTKEKVLKDNKSDKKVKSDRELQFWEAPECANINEVCTKEQTLEWIKNNPGIGLDEMDKALGLGCLKHTVRLIEEGMVKPSGDGWEVA